MTLKIIFPGTWFRPFFRLEYALIVETFPQHCRDFLVIFTSNIPYYLDFALFEFRFRLEKAFGSYIIKG